eukprot:scaffold32541_cov129-Isochrysis_galbana.AAC.1
MPRRGPGTFETDSSAHGRQTLRTPASAAHQSKSSGGTRREPVVAGPARAWRRKIWRRKTNLGTLCYGCSAS